MFYCLCTQGKRQTHVLVFEEDNRTKQTVCDSQLQLVLSSSDERVRVRILNNHSLKGQTLDKEEPCLRKEGAQLSSKLACGYIYI